MTDQIFFTEQAMTKRVIRLYHDWEESMSSDSVSKAQQERAEQRLFNALKTARRYETLFATTS